MFMQQAIFAQFDVKRGRNKIVEGDRGNQLNWRASVQEKLILLANEYFGEH